MELLLLLITFPVAIVFFIKWMKLKKFLKQLRPYYELMFNYDNNHNLNYAVISPVMAVRPRSEYSGFTGKIYFTDLEQAEAERTRLIQHDAAMKESREVTKVTLK